MTGIDWLRPGAIHSDIAAEDYHAAGITKRPALSASIAKVLIARSPLHAWTAHPQLNPDWQPTERDTFDLGSAAHVLFLEGDTYAERIMPVDAPDWRTKAALAAKEAARAAGLIPILAKHWQRTVEMVDAIRMQLAELEIDPPLFTDGKPEQTLIWEEDNGVVCKARLDWLHDDLTAIDDLKSTSASANPQVWGRRIFWSTGCDLQAAFYCRGLQAVTGKWPEFRFLAVELDPPYALSVLVPGPSTFTLGQRKVEYAIRKWGECLTADRWPSYQPIAAEVDLDAWQESAFVELTYAEEEMAS